MKIKDAAHAVEILKILVNKGEKLIQEQPWFRPGSTKITLVKTETIGKSKGVAANYIRDGEGIKFFDASVSLVPALIEGARAMLSRYGYKEDNSDVWGESEEAMLIDLARAYVPWMDRVGMDVPGYISARIKRQMRKFK